MKLPKLLGPILTAALVVASLASPIAAGARTQWQATALAPSGTPLQGSKSLSTQLAQTDKSLLRITSSAKVPVIVKYDYDAVASYQGGVSGYDATSPAATGRPVAKTDAAVAAYSKYVAQREREITSAIRARISGIDVQASFRLVYGGAAMAVPGNQIRKLLSVPGVVAVQRNKLEQPQTSVTPDFVGASDVWPSLGGSITAGDNVIVGILDSGIWPEHPSFADQGLSPMGGSFGCEFGDGSNPRLGAAFTCNDKLIGAYAFVDTYVHFIGALTGEFCDVRIDTCSARDADGHGTHTASTAAGGPVASAPIFGMDRGPISGMAPGARVIAYRVCLDLGCFNSDSMAAVEQAITDGIDVINYSISGGNEPYSDAVELAFLDAYAAGILVNASAGNEGPGPGTVAHGSPWVTTVGASSSNRRFMTTLRLTADGGAKFRAQGSTITPGVGGAPVIMAEDVPGYDDPLCDTKFVKKSAKGMVVVCSRGGSGRLATTFNVNGSGAAGEILYNPSPQDLFTDNHYLPTVMLEGPQPAGKMLKFIQNHTGVFAKWSTGVPTTVTGDVMATFSSRGPSPDFIKPDVTAPGLQILAGTTPVGVSIFSGSPGELFQAIAGTSMSSPHSAGVSALIKSAHPTWTPGQVKSALMTSSVQTVVNNDGSTATPFDDGSGSIRADRAVSPTLTFDETAANYFASASDTLGRVDLNIPSVNAPLMPGEISTTRYGMNVSGGSRTFTISTDAPAGVTIDASSPDLSIANGATFELDVTISAPGVPEGQYFGSITLDPNIGNNVFIPVAFYRTAGGVSLSHECDDTTIGTGGNTDCSVTVQNNEPVLADYDLTVTSPDSPALAISNISSPGTPAGTGFTSSGTLSESIAPTVDAITAGGSPAGFLPLAGLGVTPIGGFGDETIENFDTTSFLFGGESYSSVAMTSNGYAVVGGGDGVDVNYIPQVFPYSARPNNVIAPFWTDLNGDAGGEFYAAELTDGVNNWVVLEWNAVPVYTGGAPVSFQIWLQTGASESVTWAYGSIPGSGDPAGLTIGAENRNGTSGINVAGVPASGTDWTLDMGTPTAGGAVTITYRATGNSAGFHDLIARMESSFVPGVSQEDVTIDVG